MKKLKRMSVLVLSVCMLFGGTITLYAAGVEKQLRGWVTKETIYAEYTHDAYGETLRLSMFYAYEDKETGVIIGADNTSFVRTGGYNFISHSKNAESHYYFDSMDVYIEINGVLTGGLYDIQAT